MDAMQNVSVAFCWQNSGSLLSSLTPKITREQKPTLVVISLSWTLPLVFAVVIKFYLNSLCIVLCTITKAEKGLCLHLFWLFLSSRHFRFQFLTPVISVKRSDYFQKPKKLRN